MTTKIFNQRNNNILKRIVLDIKSKKPLDYNPRANASLKIYHLPLNKTL